jgi:hypothetical protein
MRSPQSTEAIRQTLMELSQAHVTAALCVSRLQELVGTDAASVPAGATKIPRADEAKFAILCGSRRCYLGYTKCFRLFVRLLRRANHYVSYDSLLRDVWDGDVKSPDTVRSAVRELKHKLRRARMTKIARAIRGQGRHYGLILERTR